MLERWTAADKQGEYVPDGEFPHWYFDEMTERQKNRLQELGERTWGRGLTKGKASDLIGMHEPPDEDDKEKLKFFKVSTRGLTQTQARIEVGRLFRDPANVEAWKSRPPTTMQREFFRFAGMKMPKGTTRNQAETLIVQKRDQWETEGSTLGDEWDEYEMILDDFTDRDYRDMYEIKKPSAALLRQAIQELRDSGKSLSEIRDDDDVLVDKLKALKPDLDKPE